MEGARASVGQGREVAVKAGDGWVEGGLGVRGGGSGRRSKAVCKASRRKSGGESRGIEVA
jgi:hypothetical protein